MKQLQKTERKEIAYLKKKGYSVRGIAEMLNRAPSTISRELKRNAVNEEYDGDKAHLKAYQRRYWVKKESPRLWNNDWQVFRKFLKEKLAQEHPWSPEQICKNWSVNHPSQTISYSTIYRYINRWEFKLKKNLPHQRYNWKIKKRVTPKRNLIPNRIWIDERPEYINKREKFGDWEGDTLGSKKGETHTILGLIERKSRYLVASVEKNRKPKNIARTMKNWVDAHNINSVTLDNGIEFTKHKEIGCDTFFCHPYSSWEKGQIEYAMRLLRRLVPKKSSMQDLSNNELEKFITHLNNMPRKCLNWQTPKQVFDSLKN